MAIKDDIARFLRSNRYIGRINFAFGTYKVYPGAYQNKVADAIDNEDIMVRLKGTGSAAVGAAYDVLYDSLELSPSFSVANARDQGFLIHECTHAILDIQTLGSHSAYEDEAVGYLAEAVFLEAAGQPPLGSQAIRTVSHGIARTVLAGTYWIPAAVCRTLTAEVARHPNYSSKVNYESNAFRRDLIHSILR